MKIELEISSCRECPYFKKSNPWSSDGFDQMIDWVCSVKNKVIQHSVEWHEESKIEIPSWCPKRLNQS